jgi:hypothetical protein
VDHPSPLRAASFDDVCLQVEAEQLWDRVAEALGCAPEHMGTARVQVSVDRQTAAVLLGSSSGHPITELFPFFPPLWRPAVSRQGPS